MFASWNSSDRIKDHNNYDYDDHGDEKDYDNDYNYQKYDHDNDDDGIKHWCVGVCERCYPAELVVK